MNNRYGECERRLFALLAKSGERVFVLGPDGDVLVANAVQDGFFEDKKVPGQTFDIHGSDGYFKSFPLTFTYWVTDAGLAFIKQYMEGSELG